MPLEDLLNPSNIKIKELGKNESEFHIEAFERGYGHTLGFTMKQALLYSLEGATICSIKINKGKITSYEDEIATKENVAEFLLNLKDLNFNIANDINEGTAKLTLTGKSKEVLSQDLELSEGLSIEEDIFICKYAGRKKLEAEIIVRKGTGYVESNKLFDNGAFIFDEIYSPILFCDYEVGNARVGKKTNLDKITLRLRTDGTITPSNAVKEAAQNIQKQLSKTIDVEKIKELQQAAESVEEQLNPILLKHVEELNLTARSLNCLKASNIRYISELIVKKEMDLLKAPNFGKKSLNEIKDKLAEHDLALGMDAIL